MPPSDWRGETWILHGSTEVLSLGRGPGLSIGVQSAIGIARDGTKLTGLGIRRTVGFGGWPGEDGYPASPTYVATNRFRARQNFSFPGNRVKEIPLP